MSGQSPTKCRLYIQHIHLLTGAYDSYGLKWTVVFSLHYHLLCVHPSKLSQALSHCRLKIYRGNVFAQQCTGYWVVNFSSLDTLFHNVMWHDLSFNFTQLIIEPIQIKLITNVENYINNISINKCTSALSSDHSIVTFDIAATYSFKKTTRYVLDFSKCDFDRLNSYLLDIDFTPCFDCDNINSCW